MYSITFSRHTWGFKHIGVLSDDRIPTCGIITSIRYHDTFSTHVSLRGDHVCCRLDQHQPSLTPQTHIMLNLLDTAQLNLDQRLSWQGLKHMCATMLTTVHFHCTGLPIDTGIGGLQPIYTQHYIMIQLRQNSAVNSTMQSLAIPRAYNQGYTTRL